MSIRDDFESWLDETVVPEEDRVCSFCGDQNWSGAWSGIGVDVLVCRDCASRVLPRLMADAVCMQDARSSLAAAERTWARAETEFWHGLAYAAVAWAKASRT